MNLTIRRARTDEAEILTDLSMRAKRSNGYDDAFMKACRNELTVTAARMEEGEYWVADSGIICGCVCLQVFDGGYGQVHAFFIDPDRQRQGVGRLLWRKVLERAKILGIKSLSLDADPAAVPFYRAMGFIEIGQTPSGSIEGRMLPKMEYQLEQIAHRS
ncbi:MAG: GNAT family N-acetyltransferase [Pseudomonadota bacterium]